MHACIYTYACTYMHTYMQVGVGMQEQAAAALADLAYRSKPMQRAIIENGGVPRLLGSIRTGSQAAQEHAARTVRNLSETIENQRA